MATNNYASFNECVLLVDDEPELLATLVDSLQETSLKVKTFESPVAALEFLKEARPFLVVSDFRMGQMTGIEFCTEVKKIYWDVPCVLMTAFADKDVAINALNMGLDALIEKPFDIDSFIKQIFSFADLRIEQIEKEKAEMNEILQSFAEEASDLFVDMENLILRFEERPIDATVVNLVFRRVHSVKGGASALPGGETLSKVAHKFESVLSKIKDNVYLPEPAAIDVFLQASDLCLRLIHLMRDNVELSSDILATSQNVIASLEFLLEVKEAPIAEASTTEEKPKAAVTAAPAFTGETEDEGVMVSSNKLDSFMSLSGELIVLKNEFQMLANDQTIFHDAKKLDKKLHDFSFSLTKITDRLKEQIMAVRKVTLNHTFSRLPRMVRETSNKLGKKINLNVIGGELGVDKTIAKALGPCMTHLVRNSIDHGIEMPKDRTQKGKSDAGTITINAFESSGMIYVSVEDDGGGLNKDRILHKALEKNIVTQHQIDSMSDSEAFDLIFAPGFSTAEVVSEVSGRGVGMDVVKNAIVQLQGKVIIESTPGVGSKFIMEIPVPKSVNVEQTVVVRSQGIQIAIPLMAVSQISSCNNVALRNVGGRLVGDFDETIVPIIRYSHLENFVAVSKDEASYVIVIKDNNRKVGLLVDAIEYQLEAVVRHFDNVVHAIKGFKGTTVLSDDSIAYVMAAEDFVDNAMAIGEA